MKIMKLIVSFLFVLLLSGLPTYTLAQENEDAAYIEAANRYVSMPFEVLQAEFKVALDKVLPGAIYEEQLYNGRLPISYSCMIKYNNEWFSILRFDEIIFNRKLESDTGAVPYSDEDLIKAYVYLQHFPYVTATGEGSRFFKGAPYLLSIRKIDEVYDTGMLLNEYKEMGYTNTKLNYEVIFEWNKDFYSPKTFKYSYKFNIDKGEIVSILQKTYSDEIDFSKGELYVREKCENLFFPEYSPEGEKYKYGRRYRILQSIKQKKGAMDGKTLLNDNWNKVEFVPVGSNDNFDDSLSKTNTNFLHMRTAIYLQGVPQLTYYRTKFTVFNAVSLSQPIIKVFTNSLFGSKELLFESPLNIETRPNGVVIGTTTLEYEPANDSRDGFCTFEIWDGNTLVTQVKNSYLCLYKNRIETISGMSKPLCISYAERFFYNHPSGQNYYSTFLNKLVVNFSEVWNNQVSVWKINQGNPPANDATNYRISIHPYQPNSKLLFYRNRLDENASVPTDMFQDFTGKRHIGFSAHPLAKVASICSNCNYTEDEIMLSALHHEFFHGMQYTFNTTAPVKENYWIVEGQARALQSIACPQIELVNNKVGLFCNDACTYIVGKTNTSLLNMSYYACLFWRFLYENYNTNSSIQDKLEIFRDSWTNYSVLTLPSLEQKMNSVLNTTTYPTMDTAMQDFIKRVALNDPEYNLWNPNPSINFYNRPNTGTIIYNDSVKQQADQIPCSYGVDYLLINFASKGKAFINFNGNPLNEENEENIPEFYLNLVMLDKPEIDNIIPVTKGLATLEIELTSSNMTALLIISRIDSKDINENGIYSVIVSPAIPDGTLKADFSKIFKKSSHQGFLLNSEVSFVYISHAGLSPITSWRWSFPGGIPASSNQKNPPPIVYNEAGVYPVSLEVVDEEGKSDTKCINDYIIIYEQGGGGSTPNTIEISGSNPIFASPQQMIAVNLVIETGVPPFNVEINFGDGSTYHSEQSNELFYNLYHSYSEEGSFLVTYKVIDSDGNIGLDSSPIGIGNPGTQVVDFNFSWSNSSNPNVLGTNIPVHFIDNTSGGYKPYSQWQWVVYKGINTGVQPLFSDGSPFVSIINWDKDRNMSGSPTQTVSFTEYDLYPVSLMVFDSDGWQIEETKLIQVSEAEKCLVLHNHYMLPFDKKLKKHFVKLSNTETELFSDDRWFTYFNFWHPSQYCYNEYPSGQYPGNGGKENVITNARWQVFKGNTLKYNQPYAMPDNWASTVGGSYICDVDYNWAGWWDGCQISLHPYFVNYRFNEAGIYKVQLEAWNRFVHPSANSIYPGNTKNLSMYSVLNEAFYVVNCEENQYINTSLSNPVYEDQLAGAFYFSNLSPVLVSNLTKIAYEACNEVVLHQGFTASLGSDFRASIARFDYNRKSKGGIDSFYKLTNHFQEFNIYPNPNDGTFRLLFNGLLPSTILIFDMLGRLCLFEIDTTISNTAIIKLNNPLPGVYMLKFLTSTGEEISSKFVVN